MPLPALLYLLVVLALGIGVAALVATLRRPRPRADEVNERIATLERDLAAERTRANEAERALAEKTGSFAMLEVERQRVHDAFITARNETIQLQSRIAELKTEARSTEDTIRQLRETREEMAQRFQLLANDVLQRHGTAFATQNKQQIDAVLLPLREQMTEFRSRLETAHGESLKERAVLADQVSRLSETSARMSSETTSLTQALRGSSQTQGAWGEMILASILERSGLRKGEEYVVQDSHTTEEGVRLRPDVTVVLPGDQRIIIDSKVSLTAFEACIGATAEEERQGHLKRHVQSMQMHIKTLARKEYHAAAGSGLDYVLMFVPIEGALAAALQCDPEITAFAVQNGVAIATPTTLMVALRTVESIWKIERRNRNADDIAERAGKMYDKFVNFLDDLTDLGKRLEQAQASYRGAFGKLRDGSGNLLGQFEKLKELGARTNKSLPVAMVDG